MEVSENNKVVFPSEEEVKSYFSDDEWNAMADYERSSYRNIMHNYYVMKSLDLKPKKPLFMILNRKKDIKRKAMGDICPVPAKTPVKENAPYKVRAKVQGTPVKKKEGKQVVKQQNKTVQLDTEPQIKAPVLFNESHKWESIRAHCVFSTVFKVYKRYHGIIKGLFASKRKPLTVSQKYATKEVKNVEKETHRMEKDGQGAGMMIVNVEKCFSATNDAENSTVIMEQTLEERQRKHDVDKHIEKGDEKNHCVATDKTDAKESLEEGNPSSGAKEQECTKQTRKVVIPQTKPVCRSVQTMTVADGCSPSDSALVFVNARSSRKLPAALSNPAPINVKQQKLIKNINKKKRKNCRTVQTQTAEENSSVEEVDLVFFPKPPKKVTSKPDASTKEVSSITEINPPSVNSDSSKLLDLAPQKLSEKICENEILLEKGDLATKDKNDDGSSEDEFGFYGLAGLKKETKPNETPSTKGKAKTTKPQLGDLTTPDSEKRYPKRAVPVVNYTEAELLEDDEYLFCDFCDREHEGDCPEHGPHKFFPDRFTPVTGDNNRAIQTTPAMLKVGKSKIPGAGSGVWTVLGLPPHVRFGPYQGDKVSEPDPLGYSWAIVKNKKVDHYIAAHSTATSNWMRFVNCARHESEQNVMAFQYKGELYYRTVKLIPPKTELFVWYGKEYAELLGISMESFRSKDTSHLNSVVFTCDKCNITYSSPLYLEVHEKRCWGKVVVAPSEVPTDMESLAVVVDDRKTYCCNLCGYRCTYSGIMKRHLMCHSGDKPYTCDVCHKGFKCVTDLNLHKSHHCDYAFKQSTDLQSSTLSKHMRTHTQERPYKCSECEYATAYSHVLTSHMRTHTQERPYKCSVCAYATARSGDLTKHMRTHTQERPFKCSVCAYATTESGALTTHMRTHTQERPYKCSVCAFATTQSTNLTTHMRTHTQERPYKCSVCAFATTQSTNLTTHMRTHTQERPYKCSVCAFATAYSHVLTRHLRKHTQERPYKCSVCVYATTDNSALTSHMRKHTQERPYKCSVCVYATTDNSALTSHMRKHTQERPYKCSVCAYATTQSTNLTKHMRTHTGEKPHTCPHCSYRSGTKRTLREHIARYHTSELT